jgi:hypothetical protein
MNDSERTFAVACLNCRSTNCSIIKLQAVLMRLFMLDILRDINRVTPNADDDKATEIVYAGQDK